MADELTPRDLSKMTPKERVQYAIGKEDELLLAPKEILDWLKENMSEVHAYAKHSPFNEPIKVVGKEKWQAQVKEWEAQLAKVQKNRPDREELEKKLYGIVLAIRTEGVVRSKTKWFAELDTKEILALFGEK